MNKILAQLTISLSSSSDNSESGDQPLAFKFPKQEGEESTELDLVDKTEIDRLQFKVKGESGRGEDGSGGDEGGRGDEGTSTNDAVA